MRETKKPAVIILHGWGLRGNLYHKLASYFESEGFSVFSPDLPGFGAESLKKKELTLDDYVNFVKSFIKKNIHGEFILIGHSFGGRIAIVIGAENPKNLTGLILTGAAGIKHPLPLRSKIAFYLGKYPAVLFTIPPFFYLRDFFQKLLYHFTGEFNYYKAGKLRETFKNIIAKDLTEYLPRISVPTLLVWGEKDIIVPVADGEFMTKHILNSQLIIVKNEKHRLPYESPKAFFDALSPFLKNYDK